MNYKILVIGGTGMLGLPVARKLKEDGLSVAILTTDVDRARTKLGDEFDLIYGDVTDIESLKSPMEGRDFVYLNLSSQLDPKLYQEIEIDGTANAARVAQESGIKRISLISGASSKGEEKGILFLDAKVKAERALMDSGVPFTIMRPSWFFEGLPHFIQRGRAVILGKQPIKRGWLAASDYARQVSTAFQSDDAANKCFYNLGPQELTIMEALRQYCARCRPDMKPTSMPFAVARMLSLVPGQQMLRRAIPFFEYFESQPEDSSSIEADRLLGPNLTTLGEWLETHLTP